MFVYQLFAVPVYLSPLARSCHHSGNAVPSVWQGRAIVVAPVSYTHLKFQYYSLKEMQKNDEGLYFYLMNGEIDLLLSGIIYNHDSVRVIATYNSQPYYICLLYTSKMVNGNSRMSMVVVTLHIMRIVRS